MEGSPRVSTAVPDAKFYQRLALHQERYQSNTVFTQERMLMNQRSGDTLNDEVLVAKAKLGFCNDIKEFYKQLIIRI